MDYGKPWRHTLGQALFQVKGISQSRDWPLTLFKFLKENKMTRKDIILAVSKNPNIIIRQKDWLPYEGLQWNNLLNTFIDETGVFSYPNLSSFSDKNWEIRQDSYKVY